MRELAGRPNVTVKISGAGAEADPQRPLAPQAQPVIHETLRLFGAERCMIGSDFPVSVTSPAAYQDWITIVEESMAGASDGERASVTHRTAARVYQLTEEPGQAPNQEKD